MAVYERTYEHRRRRAAGTRHRVSCMRGYVHPIALYGFGCRLPDAGNESIRDLALVSLPIRRYSLLYGENEQRTGHWSG
jgi:hypothetical protein